jgi:hypothetical protein
MPGNSDAGDLASALVRADCIESLDLRGNELSG